MAPPRIDTPKDNPTAINVTGDHATFEANGRKYTVRYVSFKGERLPVPIIDNQPGLNPSKEFIARIKVLQGKLDTVFSCKKQLAGLAADCTTTAERNSTGTVRNIFINDHMIGDDSILMNPEELSKLIGIDVAGGTPEYTNFRDALGKNTAYGHNSERNFMGDISTWINTLYGKYSQDAKK